METTNNQSNESLSSDVATPNVTLNQSEVGNSSGAFVEGVPHSSETGAGLTSHWLKANTKLGGWLILILFYVFISVIWNSINGIIGIKEVFTSGNSLLIIASVFPLVGLILYGLFTLIGFTERQKWAVSIARCFVVLVLLFPLFSILQGGWPTLEKRGTFIVIYWIVWGLVFSFFTFSKNVKKVIPIGYRKCSVIGWIGVAFFFVVPLICGNIYSSKLKTEIESQMPTQMKLKDGEKGDNRIAFKVPAGFECEEVRDTVESETSILFVLNNDDWGSCYITSAYASDVSLSDFRKVRENWLDPELSNSEGHKVDSGKTEHEGVKYIYETTAFSYNDTEIRWYFTIACHHKEQKIAILSFYYRDDSQKYVDEIVSSLRFK